MCDVSQDSESRRWASDLEVRRERWWEKRDSDEGASTCSDCWLRTMAFERKFVSVEFVGLGRALPTFSFGFYMSLFVS